ncbi:GWxTD domain-containing protein [bacterium]|nr:GWxTD domain-containing protein [bacterium]MBT7311402.1 GWxTD domain-containing protein [bacterium]
MSSNLFAALLTPLEGVGDLRYTIDAVSNYRSDGLLDLEFIFSVPNREIRFIENENGSFDGRVGVSVYLSVNEKEVISKHKNIITKTYSEEELISGTLQQVFSLHVPAVNPDDYEIVSIVRDLNRTISSHDDNAPWARSEVSFNLPLNSDFESTYLSDPVFLCGSAMSIFDRNNEDMSAYYHPNRRYGTEEQFLQFQFTAYGCREPSDNKILVQIIDKAQSIACRDTIVLNPKAIQKLQLGKTVALGYELDVSNFDSGEYLLSCALFSGNGNCWVAGFTIDHSPRVISLPAHILEAVGRMLFTDIELDNFLEGNYTSQLSSVKLFWANLMPDNHTGINPLLAEFERRITLVESQYQGFSNVGPIGDRGLVYMLLGEPDELQQQVVPLNSNDFDEAVVRVFDSWALERYGSTANNRNGISNSRTVEAESELSQRANSYGFANSHELWIYDSTGWQLFPNQFSDKSMGLRFLFVDRSGAGTYSLELTNAWKSASGN